MKENRLRLGELMDPSDNCHILRVKIPTRSYSTMHCHDYAEIFWVEKGGGYHLINGHKVRLSMGDLYMIRPDDTHAFDPDSGGVTIVNIGFTLENLRHLRERYFAESETFFWNSGDMPYHIRLTPLFLNRVSTRADETIRSNKTNLDLDSMLLFIFRQIRSIDGTKHQNSNMPLWLFNACEKYCTPEMFRGGMELFVELCGRNIGHVNRSVKQYFNDKTLTEMLNEKRLIYASEQLATTSTPIKEISTDCGFSNLGHFYKTFKAFFGTTPKEFRAVNKYK